MEESPSDLGATTITLYHPDVFLRAIRKERERLQSKIEAAKRTGINEKALLEIEMDYRELSRIEKILEERE